MLVIFLFVSLLVKSQTFETEKLWNKIDNFESQGMPASAKKISDSIYYNAAQTHNYPQFIKAFIYKMKYRKITEDVDFTKNMMDAERMLDSVPFPVNALLHSMVAEMYWWYYENNRYKFYNRSKIEQFIPNDIATWDLSMIVNMVVSHYRKSILDTAKLKKIPMSDFSDIIEKYHTNLENIKPSMYDFLTLRAIEFFESHDPGLTKPGDEFSINNDEYFLSADKFILLHINTTDTSDFKYYAISLFQNLLNAHINDSVPEYLIDIDLKRLAFINSASLSVEKDSLYINSLNFLEKKSEKWPNAGIIGSLIAEKLYSIGSQYDVRNSENFKWFKKKSEEKCLRVMERYPDEKNVCNQIIRNIKRKDVSISIENGNIPEEPFRALVGFQNTDTIFLRVIPTTLDLQRKLYRQFVKERHIKYIEWNTFLMDFLKNQKRINDFNIKLPDSHDYQMHYAEIKIPALETGLYYILASTNAHFGSNDNVLTYGLTTITNISYINRNNEKGENEFFVLNRKTGSPIPGVRAECWQKNYSYDSRNYSDTLISVFESDKNGNFSITHIKNNSYWIDFKYKNDQLSSKNLDNEYSGGSFYNYVRSENMEQEIKTFFFTDRSIYRPGQTIYFKGIVLNTDGNRNNKLLKNYSSNIVFNDVNNQTISKITLVTNEFGSFNGSFVAPKTGLNGNMTIEDDNSSISISVEDYKRPTFEIKMDSLSSGFKLNELITATGSAVAYSGAKLDGVKVKYRVVRQTRILGYWSFWNPKPESSDKEIAHGNITTNKDGKFIINFTAIPDIKVDAYTDPAFTFSIYVDVTDINGETHSNKQDITIGYKALVLEALIPDRVERNADEIFNLKSKNLDDNFIPASGRITIQKIHNPDRFFRTRQWHKPDVFVISKNEFYKDFPDDQYSNELDITTWKPEKTVLETIFDTKISENFKMIDKKYWNAGIYLITMDSKDKYGIPVHQKRYFTLYDKNSNILPFPQAELIEVVKNNAEPEPGDTVSVLLGSAYDKVNALIELETPAGYEKIEKINLSNQQHLFKYLIKESYRGNIAFHFTFIRNNRLYSHTQVINVPYTNKMLDLKFSTFRNKLQPGEKEQWKLTVNDKKGEMIAAEMVATLYDASLDVFKPHSFAFNLWPAKNYFADWTAGNCFEKQAFKHLISPSYFSNFKYDPDRYYLKWFGFNFNLQYIPIKPVFNYNNGGIHSTYKIISSQKQKGTFVYGTILDVSTQEPIIGANVLIVGTNNGVATDLKGNFQIKSSSNDIKLKITFVGYESQIVDLVKNGKVNLLVSLAPEISNLQEVVVVGFGVQKKTMLTSSISTISSVPMAEERSIDKDKKSDVSKKKEQPQPDLSTIQARTNLHETAFFYPQLQTNENGEIVINFTIPEALTRWKMLGFAHTKDLSYGFIQNELITQKTLMVTPNTPRFLREGDTITFTSKVASLVNNNLSGDAKLSLFDALTMKPIDSNLNNMHPQQSFSIAANGSTNLNWKINIPVGIQAITYRVVAQAGDFSDGEESTLPVLTNSMLVTETLPLPVRGHQIKTFTLDKLLHNTSTTLRSNKLTLEFTSNPAWYAIQALPYLMEYPYECAEQTFSRFYANSISSNIVNSSPRIKQVFESWKNSTPDALLSNLEKNQELKSVLLEETPWILNAQSENDRKKHVALLFDLNKMSDELDLALIKLEKMQVSNGGWPWFAGMPDDRYITQHIVSGMGKLDHLGVKNIRTDSKTWQMVSKAIKYTDQRILEDYQELKRLDAAGKTKLSANQLNYLVIHYLYARSFFNDIALEPKEKEALNYFLNQAKTYWLSNNLYMQGMIALAIHRFNETDKEPLKILRSFKENAMHSEEMGMYWKYENGWFWYQAPIETQALMIETFDEVANDSTSVNEMKVWLLKQKQTQDWKTTRATTEACYALLLRGNSWLVNDNQVSISVGKHVVNPSKMPDVKVEAGTGYFKTSWNGSDITSDMGTVTITKKDNGVSWGAMYWQYFEQLDKITSAETPLKMHKQLFVERIGATGPVIVPISDTTHLKPGDLLKVRIELRVDRDMEYVHMKDMRASCLEPVNVISQYKYQYGLGYYESTRDAATNFFFGWLPKGTHVFEYSLRVTHYGNFSNGIGSIQCMYAPEFMSHSEGVRVVVK